MERNKKNLEEATVTPEEFAEILTTEMGKILNDPLTETNELPSIHADSGVIIGIDLCGPIDAGQICVGVINAGLITTKVSELLERAGIIYRKLLTTEERSKNKLYKVNVSRMAKTTGDMILELMHCITDLEKQALQL